jgi:TetR/AcrR family transcriptional regulator, cholesterol catabolism regulator
MTDRNELLRNIRKILINFNFADFQLKILAAKLNIQVTVLEKLFVNEEGLVSAILNFEQDNLEKIFDLFHSDDNNAIDIFINVSRELDKHFEEISPSIQYDLRKYFPVPHQQFIEKRMNFVFDKMKRNIEQGINQGLYRPDLSTELVSRIYISRLMDIHNPDYFPNSEISFELLFNVMVDTFVRGICTEKGLQYYTSKKKEFNL